MTPNASRVLKTVDEILLDAGQSHASELRAALLSLGSFASLPAPAPSAEVMALMTGFHAQPARGRWPRRHRPAVIGLAVMAGMGLGASGVAATAQDHRQPTSISIQQLLNGWGPSWSITGVPSARSADSLAGQPPETPLSSAGEPRPPHLAPKLPKSPAMPAPPAAPAASGASAASDAPAASGGSGAKAGVSTPEAVPADAALSRTVQEGAARESERALDPAAREFERVQELLAVRLAHEATAVESLTPVVPVPALAAKSGAAKNAKLGAQWLRKFSR